MNTNVRNRKFYFASGIILIATVLLCWKVITAELWVHVTEVIGGAYLTANVLNRGLDYHYGRKEFDYMDSNRVDSEDNLKSNRP